MESQEGKALTRTEQLERQVELSKKNSEMINRVYAGASAYREKVHDSIHSPRNHHDQLSALADALENALEEIERHVPKEPFKNIDTRPTPLLFMTDEDMVPKSPEIMREELIELIKEAK